MPSASPDPESTLDPWKRRSRVASPSQTTEQSKTTHPASPGLGADGDAPLAGGAGLAPAGAAALVCNADGRRRGLTGETRFPPVINAPAAPGETAGAVGRRAGVSVSLSPYHLRLLSNKRMCRKSGYGPSKPDQKVRAGWTPRRDDD